MKIKMLLSLIAASSIIYSAASGAAETSTTFNVTANVNPACSIGADDVLFGTVTQALVDGTLIKPGKVTVICSQSTPYAVRLTPQSTTNTNGAGELANLTTPSAKMIYGIYTDASAQVAWGNETGNDVEGTGNNTNQDIPLYVRLTTFNATPGEYKDTVTATVVY